MTFGQDLAQAVLDAGNPCCVGLDPHLNLLPTSLEGDSIGAKLLRWSVGVIDALEGVVPALKPQVALYEEHGSSGWVALETAVSYAKEKGFQVILDAKRGDIGSTASAYARMGLDNAGPLGAQSMTVSPYLGPESLDPFQGICDAQNKGLWILVRTSNPGAEKWQLNDRPSEVQAPAYRIADWIEGENRLRRGTHGLGPFGAVVGATLKGREPADLRVRMPSTWLLVPGYGAQGATAESLRPFFRDDGLGAIIVSARGVLFSPDKEPEGYDWREKVRERACEFRDNVIQVMP